MRRSILVAAAALLVAASALAPPPTAAAEAPDAGAGKPCPFDVQATSVAGDPNAATVRIADVPPVSGSRVTAYGAVTRWSGTLTGFARADNRGRAESSFTVRADGPIEGIVYEPANAACVARTAVRARTGYDGPDVQRPVIALSNAEAVEPVACARRYAAPVTLHAMEPYAPAIAVQQNIGGIVRVSVMLDEQGKPTSAAIWSSPSAILNASAMAAAKGSTYSPQIFRCRAVPSSYLFTVSYG